MKLKEGAQPRPVRRAVEPVKTSNDDQALRASRPEFVEFRPGVDLRPGSDELVPSPDSEQYSAANDRLLTAIRKYSKKGPGFAQGRKLTFEKYLANWLRIVESWVAEDPAARSGWAESILWYYEWMMINGDKESFALHSREVWEVGWQGLFPIWSKHASEAHREERRHTKWWLWPLEPGNYSLYITGLGRGVMPDRLPYARDLICRAFGWDLESADALIRRAIHVEPQLLASGISEEAAILYKTEFGPLVRMKIKSGATGGANGRREAISEQVRHEVWRRDQGHCVDCGSRERLEFDHIIPISKGGANTTRNIAAAEKIMRLVPAVVIPGLRKSYCRRADVARLLEERTFEKDRVVA